MSPCALSPTRQHQPHEDGLLQVEPPLCSRVHIEGSPSSGVRHQHALPHFPWHDCRPEGYSRVCVRPYSGIPSNANQYGRTTYPSALPRAAVRSILPCGHTLNARQSSLWWHTCLPWQYAEWCNRGARRPPVEPLLDLQSPLPCLVKATNRRRWKAPSPVRKRWSASC